MEPAGHRHEQMGLSDNLHRVVRIGTPLGAVVAATTLRWDRAFPMATDYWQDSFQRGTVASAIVGVRTSRAIEAMPPLDLEGTENPNSGRRRDASWRPCDCVV